MTRRSSPAPWMVALAALGLAMPVAAQRAPAPASASAATTSEAAAGDIAEAATRPALAIGAPVALRLSRGQEAFFRLPEGGVDLVAQTRNLGRDTDTVLALLDRQGRILAEDDDGGDESLASRIEIAAHQRGPLFLRVRVLEAAAGAFELVLEPAPARDPAAPAGTLAEAAVRPELTAESPVTIALLGRQEAYFRLPADSRDLVALTRRLAAGTDTALALLDANGREIAEDDDGGEENLASRIEVPAGQRRPLFLRARTLGGPGNFDIVLLPDTTPAAPPFPASLREAAAAPALSIGEAVPLRLRRGQAAFFRLPDGDIAVLTRNLRRGTDTVLVLLDASGAEIADDDDGGGGLASRLEVAGGEARPLYVRAALLGDGGGDFELVVEADAPGAAGFPGSLAEAAAAPPLQPGAALPIRLRRGQSAYFRLPAGEFVALTRGLREGTDTVLEILDNMGRVLAEDDDGGDENLASRLDIDASRKGDLFLRAGVLGDGAGAFELVLLPPGGR